VLKYQQMHIVVIDTETGGLDPARHSLLSVAAVLLEDGGIADSREWLVREPDELLNVEPEALAVNHIDLPRHLEQAQPPAAVAAELAAFIPRPYRMYKGRALLAGHNVGFDYGFLVRLARLAGDPGYPDRNFHHRTLDTASIMHFLALRGELPANPGGLGRACRYFGIEHAGAHTALGDATATALLLAHLLTPPPPAGSHGQVTLKLKHNDPPPAAGQ
jgi:DNA polymerase III subunit epsilon